MFGFALFGESFLFSNLCDLVHSDGYGFTVAFSFIVEVLLNGVGKGMSEVQENPLSGIKLVFFDHVALHRDAELENVLKLLARGRFVQIFKERMAFEHRGLDDLRAAIVENGVGEGR